MQLFFAGTDVHDFGMHYAWTNDLGLRVEFENLAPPKDSDRRRMTLLRGSEARRLEWNAKAHWIDKVLAADDGHLFAVGGFMGDATATIGAIDPDSGAIAVLPGAGVAGVARLDGETFVVLRFDKAKRRLCFDRLRSSGDESPIVCLDKTAPARLDKVVVAPGAHVIAAAVAGPRMASDKSVVVVDLQAAREIQRVERGALQMAVSPNGQVALQDPGGLEPIRIMKDGKLRRAFRASSACSRRRETSSFSMAMRSGASGRAVSCEPSPRSVRSGRGRVVRSANVAHAAKPPVHSLLGLDGSKRTNDPVAAVAFEQTEWERAPIGTDDSTGRGESRRRFGRRPAHHRAAYVRVGIVVSACRPSVLSVVDNDVAAPNLQRICATITSSQTARSTTSSSRSASSISGSRCASPLSPCASR